MKMYSINIMVLSIIIFLSSNSPVKSQENTEFEKIPANMYMEYHKKYDGTEGVKIKVSYRENRKNFPVAGAVVNLYLEEVSKSGMITNIVTDESGEGFLYFNERFYKQAESLFTYQLIARMASEERFEETEEEITIKRAQITLVKSESDEGNEITATVSEIAGHEDYIPIADAEIKFYIKRMFSLLPIEGDYVTDEDGMVSVIVPTDIPGDEEGNIIIIARLEEHEDYGTVGSQQTEAWGIPLLLVNKEGRSLWASGDNAPISLVIASVLIVFFIWGILFYLFFQLYNIKKAGKKELKAA
jgi:hypothetical protein